jgi:hypothetical protein
LEFVHRLALKIRYLIRFGGPRFQQLAAGIADAHGERFAPWIRRKEALFPKGGISHRSLGETD